MKLPPLSSFINREELEKLGFQYEHRFSSEGRILETYQKGSRWQVILKTPKEVVISIYDCTLKQMQEYIQECNKQEELKLEHITGI